MSTNEAHFLLIVNVNGAFKKCMMFNHKNGIIEVGGLTDLFMPGEFTSLSEMIQIVYATGYIQTNMSNLIVEKLKFEIHS